ncbi:hemerythrin domain-containing protein [Candidatus Woesearchaeota archaeon]|nr:hemerythrin domain-containing protein [Candidatus Woesearchaeota archaeon]
MKKATEILSEEHKNILKVTEALFKECHAMEEGKKLDEDFFKKAIEFIRNYADKFHHAKEEDILFYELRKDSVEMHCNPTDQMLHEHDLGRNYIKELEEGLKKKNTQKIIENAKGYAGLLQEHIFKEDNILYPMADDVLDGKVQKLMLERFVEAEKKNFAKGTKEKYLSIAKEFEKRS